MLYMQAILAKTKKMNAIPKIVALLFILVIGAGLVSCKKLIESIEPKSFVEKYYDQTLNHEWVVDSIRYTKFDESKKQISDEIKSVGKMVFEKPIEQQNDPVLSYGQGYMTHTYTMGGQTVIEKNAYRLKNSGTEIKYLELYFKPTAAPSFQGIESIIFDVQLINKNTYHLYRYEHLQDIKTGQWQGYLRSVIKMHR